MFFHPGHHHTQQKTVSTMSDWESKTVIGFKAKAPKVARNAADLNGKLSLAQLSFLSSLILLSP